MREGDVEPVRFFEEKRPLYQRVAERVSNDIRQGVYEVGALLPTEADLCAQFKVSRQTVREAIRLLSELGLVSRHQGIGTRVQRDSVVEAYVQRLGNLSDLWQYVKETHRKVLRVVEVVAAEARVALPGDPKTKWRMLEGLRFVESEKKPIAWTQVYVLPAYAAVTLAKDRDRFPIYSLIEKRYGLKARTVRQEITGVSIDKDVAALLCVAPKSVGLSVQRKYFSMAEEVFEVTISIHPADRYRHTMQLNLDSSVFAPSRGGSKAT